MSARQEQGQTDPADLAVDQAIAACDGDLRETIKALLIANAYLDAELDSVTETVSKG